MVHPGCGHLSAGESGGSASATLGRLAEYLNQLGEVRAAVEVLDNRIGVVGAAVGRDLAFAGDGAAQLVTQPMGVIFAPLADVPLNQQLAVGG